MLSNTLEILEKPKLTNTNNKLELITFSNTVEKNLLSTQTCYGMDRKNATVLKAKIFEATIRACIKCGVTKPATPEYFCCDKKYLRWNCKLCAKRYSKEWRENNPDKYKTSLLKNNERSKKRYKKNKTECDKQTREWRSRNPDLVKKYSKTSYIRHKKKINEKAQKKYQERKKLIEEENRRAIKEYEKRMQIK